MESYYRSALRQGNRALKSRVAGAESPYLQVLDQMVPPEQSAAAIDLGIISIPTEFLIGTKTAGRTRSFAWNFMPILGEDMEFATKWKRLCQAHLDEGIRDPIKVYEYKNRYYVEEGNKRASVLKYFDSVSISARVFRVMPKQDETEETKLYFEFLEFNRISKINFIEFSKLGSYAELQRRLGKGCDELWTEEERRAFSSTFYRVRTAFEANRGERLLATVGDAMLSYIRIYGYQELRSMSVAELKRSQSQIWEDIKLQQEKTAIEVKTNPEGKNDLTLLQKVFPAAKLKAAFLYDKTPERSGWTYGHEMGRRYVEQILGDWVTTTPYFNAMDGDPDAVIQQAIDDGNTVLFTTSPQLLPASLRAAIEHPEHIILNCSLNKPHRYIRTYYARMYEAQFIMGAIAGNMSRNGRVGYICDYPIYGQIAGINAFALGLQIVNPRGWVHLEWSSVDGAAAATKRLLDQEVYLISSENQKRWQEERDSAFGLTYLRDGKSFRLASPVWRWGVYYEEILRRIRNNTFQNEYEESSRSLNYYWGMSSGAIALDLSERLPDNTRRLADILREGICQGSFTPFAGPIQLQSGRKFGTIGQSLSMEQIINMEELVDNVIGGIPAYKDLNKTGKATVDIVGVEQAVKDR